MSNTDRALGLIRDNPGITARALRESLGLATVQIRQILTALSRRRRAEGRGYPAQWYALGLPEVP